MRKIFFLFFIFCLKNGLCQSLKVKEDIFECQTAEERLAFNEEIKLLKKLLYATQKENVNRSLPRAGHVLLGWPMRMSSDYDFMYNYFNLQNYVDQDFYSSNFSDYQCGNRTYNGHDASDINLYPFWWRMMDNNYVMAIAAAPGIILSKTDGYFDRNCTQTGSANSVVILHDDGSTTRYLHLKKNSLTTKIKDDRVEQGEFLGYIGSSGRSSNPHLHFAVYDSSDNLIEPFYEAGNNQCNFSNSESWWQNQRDYWEPQINRLMTHSAAPSIKFCEDDEVVNAKNQFNPSEVVLTGIAFMDGQNGDVATCSLINPSGNVQNSWTKTLSSTDSRQYITQTVLLPSGNTGTWIFKVVYRSKTYVHFFTVGCTSNVTVSGSISGNDGHIAGANLYSTAIHSGGSNSKVLYQAATEIVMKPGFEAKAGIHFKARIKPCGYAE